MMNAAKSDCQQLDVFSAVLATVSCSCVMLSGMRLSPHNASSFPRCQAVEWSLCLVSGHVHVAVFIHLLHARPCPWTSPMLHAVLLHEPACAACVCAARLALVMQ